MGKSHHDELRRAPRVRVCCRVHVRQRFAAWSAVTEELSIRGCRLVTAQQPRLGARLDLTLSSDLFAEELEIGAEVVWIGGGRLGVQFLRSAGARRRGALSTERWVARVLEIGRGEAPDRVVPVVDAAHRPAVRPHEVVRLGQRRRSG